MYYFFKQNIYSFKSEGLGNIWIVKPSGNSKGQGIQLINDLSDAIDQGQRMKARII